MIEQKDFLALLIAALDREGIPYLVTGSVGSSIYGEPRATRDVDLIIAPNETQLLRFVDAIGDDHYVSREAALDAFRSRSMFNVIGASSGWKADFIIRKDTPYEVEKFNRRFQNTYLGIPINVATPEDIILSKLTWSKASDSERQLRDAFGVVAVQGEVLDRDYMHRWAAVLGVKKLLEKIFDEVDNLNL